MLNTCYTHVIHIVFFSAWICSNWLKIVNMIELNLPNQLYLSDLLETIASEGVAGSSVLNKMWTSLAKPLTKFVQEVGTCSIKSLKTRGHV